MIGKIVSVSWSTNEPTARSRALLRMLRLAEPTELATTVGDEALPLTLKAPVILPVVVSTIVTPCSIEA